MNLHAENVLSGWPDSLSYLIICLPTKYVSWFNIWANMLGIITLSGLIVITLHADTR